MDWWTWAPAIGRLTLPLTVRSHMLSIRMSDAEYSALERVALAQDIPVSTLAREWIVEKLATEGAPRDVAELADAVAVLAQRLSALASSPPD